MARTFLPARYRFGRLVSAWHRPALLTLVLFLCGVGYYLFWATFLPYRRARAEGGGALHATLATYLWINVVWNYAMCAAVVAGEPDEKKERARRRPRCCRATNVSSAASCVRAPNFDHHCPFTGGCIGRDNFRFFALFCLWGWCGMAYACAMSWTPFSDCVLSQVTIYHIGWKAAPPPSEEACQALAARSFVFVPALVIFAALTSLFGLNALLVANNITLKRFKVVGLMNGPDGIFGFVRTLQCRTTPDIDKRMLIFGPTAGGAVGRARVLLLPSLPWIANGDSTRASRAAVGSDERSSRSPSSWASSAASPPPSWESPTWGRRRWRRGSSGWTLRAGWASEEEAAAARWGRAYEEQHLRDPGEKHRA